MPSKCAPKVIQEFKLLPENGERISFINAIAEEKKYVESPQHVRKVTSPCKNLH
jgi:hypothetical protein